MIGQTISHYRVVEKLGQGGMGVVYKAEDTRLGRPVALKFVKAEFTERFEREARAISALNHPHICTLYDVGQHEDGAPYLVMEYVAGKPLEGPLPLGDSLEFAIQIADALAAAHQAGIVHRDLKPANILVTSQGVKLLDFGLAKRQPNIGQAGTTDTMTAAGTIAGTVAYMSPEQAQGIPVDARSDIFSFGAVLYEMMTGQRAFQGNSAISTLNAILTHEPKPIEGVPPELEKIIRRCLRKEPERRTQSILDVKLALEELRDEPPPSGLVAPALAAPPLAAAARPPRKRIVPALLVLAGIIAGLCLAVLLTSNAGPDAAGGRFTPFATEAAAETMPAWSPDGKSLAYLVETDGITQVFTRSLNSPTPVQVTKSPANCAWPFWSADGTRIFYSARGDLWSSGIAGGEPRLEFKDAADAALSPDGKTLVFLRGGVGAGSLWTVSAPDGKPRQYAQEPFPGTLVALYAPAFSRDSSRLGIIVDRSSGGGSGELWIIPLPSGKPRRVPVSLPASALARFAWWPDGRHVLVGRSDTGNRHLHLMDTETGAVREFTSGTGLESQPAISPDAGKIAFTAGRIDMDLVEIPLDGSSIRPLLATSSSEESGAWLPSGSQYAYITNAGGTQEIWLRGTLESWARPILSSNADAPPPWYVLSAVRVSPDGQRVAYDALGAQHGIWISPVAGGRAMPLDTESTDQHCASWSPDGNRVAYRRLHEGKWELTTIPLGGGKPVSLGETGEGSEGRGGATDWSPTGEWICHLSPKGLDLVSPDGQRRKLLTQSRLTAFCFSGDGSALFALRRSETRRWQLAAFDVATGVERPARDLALPASARLSGLTRHPGGKRLLATLGTPRQDIWLMEGFPRPGGWWSRLWQRR